MKVLRQIYRTAPVLFLAGCTSAVVSHKYNPASPADGLKYHLMATELELIASYELDCQTFHEDGKTLKEPAKIVLTSIDVKPRVIADPAYAFVIDTSKLSNLTTSVSPAKFEFRDGTLKGITYKPKSEVRETVKELGRVAATVLPFAGLLVAEEEPLKCDATLLGDIVDLAKAKQLVADRQDTLTKADANLQTDPGEDKTFAVANAEKRLNEGKLALKAMQTELFQRTVQISEILRPPPGVGPGEPFTLEIRPSSGRLFEHWFKHLIDGPNDKRKLLTLTARIENLGAVQASAPEPGRGGYPGIYYRRAADGTVTIGHPASGFERRIEHIPLLHLGEIARLTLENGPFENRGFVLSFDDTGQLTSYEMTATAAANEMLATAADLPQTVADAEKAELERQTNLLKAEKDLLDAEKALDTITAEKDQLQRQTELLRARPGSSIGR